MNAPTKGFLATMTVMSAMVLGAYYACLSVMNAKGIAAHLPAALTVLAAGIGLFGMLSATHQTTKSEPGAVAMTVAAGMTFMSSCFAASASMTSPLFLFLGFFVGVAAAFYGLLRELDEHVAPSLMFVTVMIQLVLISLVG